MEKKLSRVGLVGGTEVHLNRSSNPSHEIIILFEKNTSVLTRAQNASKRTAAALVCG